MLRGLSAKQLDEWRAFERLEPFPVERADWHFASIVAVLSNIYRGKGKPAKATKEFLLRFGDDVEQKKPQTWQEQKAIMTQFFKGLDRADAIAEKRRAATEQRKAAKANVRSERRSSARDARTRR
jgi:hypothetical protein